MALAAVVCIAVAVGIERGAAYGFWAAGGMLGIGAFLVLGAALIDGQGPEREQRRTDWPVPYTWTSTHAPQERTGGKEEES